MLIPITLAGQAVSDIIQQYELAVEFYEEGKLEQSGRILTGIENRVCSDSEWIETCISVKIYQADIERKNRLFETAETLLTDAEEFIKENLKSPHPLEVRLYRQRVYLYVDMTDFDQARKAADNVLNLVQMDEMDEMSTARAFLAPAYLEDALGNYQESFDYYLSALEALEHLEGNRDILRFLSHAYNNMGILLRRMGRGQEAMEYYKKGLDVARLLYRSNHPEIGLLYNNLGAVYYGLGDYGQAADYFLRTVNIFRENYGDNHVHVAGGYNNAGVSYLEMDDYNSGAELLEKAQRIKVELFGENHLDTAIGYSNLATIHMKYENYDAALENYKKSLAVRTKIYGENHPNLIVPYIKMGEFYSEINEFKKSREQFREALQITESRLGNNHPDAWDITLKIGDTYEKEKKYHNALGYYKSAYTKIAEANGIDTESELNTEQISYPLLYMSAAKKMGSVYLRIFEYGGEQSDLHHSVNHFSTAMTVIDFLQYSYQSEASKLNLIDQNYSIFTNSIKAYHKLYEVTADSIWLDKIFQVSEISRSRIALELLQNLEAKKFAGVPDTILEQETDINSKIAEYYQKIHTEQEIGLDADELIISAYMDSLFSARQKLAVFTDDLEQNYPDYYELKYDKTLADRVTVSKLLKDDETLVKYIIGEEEMYALILHAEDITFRSLGSPDSLSVKIQNLRESISTNNKTQYTAYAYDLYRILIEPIMADIRSESVIIIPDQELHYLPFGMLLTRSANGEEYYRMPYLIHEKKISYAPSATVLQKMTEEKISDPINLLAVAPFSDAGSFENSQTDESANTVHLSPLPLSRYETREIAEIFRESQSFWDFISPERAELVTGSKATKSVIENINLEDYGYIHFATHAFVNEEDPALSGIAFWSDNGDDGIMYVNDIYNIDLNADLVTLGACETGLGSVYRGEGIIGFTRSFLYAGASNLMVSMWRVNDQPTANLMINFYRYMREGHSYSKSLQMAKKDLIEQPEFAAPRHWAAFLLQGR